MDTRRVEERLQAALAARAEQVKPEDMRPAALPHAPATRTARRPQRLLLALAAPATLTLVLAVTIGVWCLAGRSPDAVASPPPATATAAPQLSAATGVAVPPSDGGPATSGAATVAPVSVTASPRTTTVPGTSGRAIYPAFAVSGGTPPVTDRIHQLITGHVTGLIDAYRHRAGLRTLQITAGAIARWDHYLSVRLDTIDDLGGPHGKNTTTTALVINTRTGSPAAAGDLFTDVAAVDELMRSAISHRAGPKDSTQVGKLTMRSGAAAGLSWYPAADGLHWVLDRCLYPHCAAGQPQAVVAWRQLTALVKPTTGP